jgi:hypothetical protein
MNVFDEFLADRERQPHDDERAAIAWQVAGHRPEVRLLAFDRWIRLQLDKRLEWDWAGAQKERRIEQCRIALERVVLDLWRRGWMLDGKRLAARLTELLDAVGAYQRKGAVRDFWSYFSASIERYVGANAEEIQREAMSAGAHVGQLLGALGVKAGPREPALPELLAQRAEEIAQAKAETLRAKQARERARQAACKADAQGQLGL